MKLSKKLRKFAKSPAAFTAVLVAITVGVFGVAFAQAPRALNPAPIVSRPSYNEVTLAEQVWPVVLQAQELAVTAAAFPGQTTLNTEGETWKQSFTGIKKTLKTWLRHQGIIVSDKDMGYSKTLTLTPDVMANLNSASAGAISHNMITLLDNVELGVTPEIKNPELRGLLNQIKKLKVSTATNLKELLKRN